MTDMTSPSQPTSPSVNALIRDLEGFHDCADGDVAAGNGHFRLECISDSNQQRLNLRAVLREAAEALRALSAPRVEPVADPTHEIVIVPVEMTEEMMAAVRREIEGDASALYRSEPHSIRLFYAAALRASPPSQPDAGDRG